MCNHSVCIYATCGYTRMPIPLSHLLNVFSNVSSNCLHERMHNHIGCICLTFLHCVFSSVSSNDLPEKMHSRIGCISLTFYHCVFSKVFSNGLLENMSRIDWIGLTAWLCLHCPQGIRWHSSHHFQKFCPSPISKFCCALPNGWFKLRQINDILRFAGLGGQKWNVDWTNRENASGKCRHSKGLPASNNNTWWW